MGDGALLIEKKVLKDAFKLELFISLSIKQNVAVEFCSFGQGSQLLVVGRVRWGSTKTNRREPKI